MAAMKLGWNEGSLLRRTLLHVAAFVLGSAAFVTVASFVLVSVARGVLAPKDEAAEEVAAGAPSEKTSPAAAKAAGLKGLQRGKRGLRGAAAPAAGAGKAAAAPNGEE